VEEFNYGPVLKESGHELRIRVDELKSAHSVFNYILEILSLTN